MSFTFSNKSIERMEDVDIELQIVFVEALKVSPIDFGIPGDGGLRTAECQNELFNTGSSKCDGYENKSNHQTGNALDFYAYVGGAASWDKSHLSMVAGVIMATAIKLKNEGRITIDLVWGGTFGSDSLNGWDMPHFEVKL